MSKITLHEVGLRDGLQMEKQTVPTEQKLSWIRALAGAGVDIIQVGSFVHPEKVPQMADTDKLFAELSRASLCAGGASSLDRRRAGAFGGDPRPVLSGLVLNEKGLERGLACGVEMFCMGVSASETHSRKNTGMSIAEATERIIAIARKAEGLKKRVQVSVQSAFGCGYEGPVPQERVMGIVQRFLDGGLLTISLADTAGHAMPDQVERMFGTIRNMNAEVDLACHFHNTYGLGLANSYAAMKAGVNSIESSVAGLGGCPFTKIAGGNVCTEDLVHMLHHMGLRGDIGLDCLIAVAQDISKYFGREMPGVVYKTGPIEAAIKH